MTESIAPFDTVASDHIQVSALARSLTYQWDVATLEWVKGTQPTSGGAVAATIADGADVALGATSDAAVTTNTTGTVSGKLRGLVAHAVTLLARVPVLGQALMASSVPVALASDQSAVPISAASLPLPTGAATLAAQTQPGVDIGDVTVNNAAGAAAVNVQDGGNTITVDGTVTANQGGAPWSAVGTLTHNGGAPAANNVGTLPAIATAAAPTYSEGNQVGLSTDLAGNVRISGSISAQSSATATVSDPTYTEAASEALSQDLGGRLRTKAYGTVSDAPPTFIAGETQPISLTNDGRVRVSSADARVAEAPYSDDMKNLWGDLRPWENGKKPYFEASPWAAW